MTTLGRITSAADLGFFVQKIRTSHNLTQRQLAEQLGITQRYLSELEAGKPKRADDKYFTVLSKLGVKLTAEANLE